MVVIVYYSTEIRTYSVRLAVVLENLIQYLNYNQAFNRKLIDNF